MRINPITAEQAAYVFLTRKQPVRFQDVFCRAVSFNSGTCKDADDANMEHVCGRIVFKIALSVLRHRLQGVLAVGKEMTP